MPNGIKEDYKIRFFRFIKKDDCWNWIGSIGKNGYGYFSKNSKAASAHRVSWEIHNGQIPDGLCVLHKCDNRKCVNPDHLFIGTYYDNIHDKINKGRDTSISGLNRVKTHCLRGHRFTKKNTLFKKSGGRSCKMCQKIYQSKYRFSYSIIAKSINKV